MSQDLMKYLKVYEKKETIIHEGEKSDDLYCLVSGKVSVFKGMEDEEDKKGKKKIVKLGEIVEKGAYFGEMSYLLKEPRTASIVCDNQVKVLKFPGEMIPSLLGKQPILAEKLIKDLAERLKGTSMRSHEETVERINLREDASDQMLDAKEAFQRVFMMLSAIQVQFQHPLLKLVIEFMSSQKLVKGGRNIQISEETLQSFPPPLVPLLKKLYD